MSCVVVVEFHVKGFMHRWLSVEIFSLIIVATFFMGLHSSSTTDRSGSISSSRSIKHFTIFHPDPDWLCYSPRSEGIFWWKKNPKLKCASSLAAQGGARSTGCLQFLTHDHQSTGCLIQSLCSSTHWGRIVPALSGLTIFLKKKSCWKWKKNKKKNHEIRHR